MLLAALVGASAAWTRWLDADGQHDPLDRVVAVDIVAPKPPGKPKPKSDEPCTTGCSLAKHPIDPFTDEGFLAALDGYAAAEPDMESDALDTLLFYGARTEELLEKHGTGPLSQRHIAFLSRELARRYAIVELRLIEPDGDVRVAYGPSHVPIGRKQHLQPVAGCIG